MGPTPATLDAVVEGLKKGGASRNQALRVGQVLHAEIERRFREGEPALEGDELTKFLMSQFRVGELQPTTRNGHKVGKTAIATMALLGVSGTDGLNLPRNRRDLRARIARSQAAETHDASPKRKPKKRRSQRCKRVWKK